VVWETGAVGGNENGLWKRRETLPRFEIGHKVVASEWLGWYIFWFWWV
jgi:hypothetical protein